MWNMSSFDKIWYYLLNKSLFKNIDSRIWKRAAVFCILWSITENICFEYMMLFSHHFVWVHHIGYRSNMWRIRRNKCTHIFFPTSSSWFSVDSVVVNDLLIIDQLIFRQIIPNNQSITTLFAIKFIESMQN